MPAEPERRAGIPLWGGLALPACALWGAVLGIAAGYAFGNVMIGGAIGTGLGIGIGIAVLAAAVVKASHHF